MLHVFVACLHAVDEFLACCLHVMLMYCQKSLVLGMCCLCLAWCLRSSLVFYYKLLILLLRGLRGTSSSLRMPQGIWSSSPLYHVEKANEDVRKEVLYCYLYTVYSTRASFAYTNTMASIAGRHTCNQNVRPVFTKAAISAETVT